MKLDHPLQLELRGWIPGGIGARSTLISGARKVDYLEVWS